VLRYAGEAVMRQFQGYARGYRDRGHLTLLVASLLMMLLPVTALLVSVALMMVAPLLPLPLLLVNCRFYARWKPPRPRQLQW